MIITGTIILLLILLFIGTPVAIALGAAGMAGLYLLLGQSALIIAPKVLFDTLNDFIVLAVPLFILMGTILAKGGVGEKLYDFFDVFLRHIPGGVGIATLFTCAVLSAMCGTSVAVAAMVGSFALPNLQKLGYNLPLSLGIVTGGGALGILIPPSVPMILYSAVTGESTGKLFMAGVIPGIVALGLFCVYTILAFRRSSSSQATKEKATWKERWKGFTEGLWAMSVPVVIMVFLYTGLATPTEIAAIGCAWAFIVGLFIYRTIKLRDIIPILRQGISSAAMIMFIICGAILFGNAVTQMGLPGMISNLFAGGGIPVWGFIVITMLSLLVMGCFLEGASIMLISLPIFYPALLAYDYNLIVYAVLMVINLECAMLTPPVGLNLYAIDGIAKSLRLPSTLATVVQGSWPFLVIYLITMILVAIFPSLALWLPMQMK